MERADVLVAPPLLSSLPEPVLTPKVNTGVIVPTSPWGKVTAVESVSLNDVMSEQLISALTEEKPAASPDYAVLVDNLTSCEDVTDCSDDFLLAKMLQLEFDKEHDEILKHEESSYNGQSKVKISYGKYRRLPPDVALSDDDEEDKEFFLEQTEKNHWSNFEQAEKTFQAVGKSGVSRQGNVTTTKHDHTVCGRRNAEKLMMLNPCISTGDGGTFDMKLSNNVYNTLRAHSKAEFKRSNRLHEKKENSTTEKALDEKTHLILYKLVNNQTLESVTGCIATGKESCVYHAWSGLPEEESVAPEFAIKVYKTTLNEFHNRDQYIKDDHRFRNRFSKQNPRKVVHLWAEKEMRNLIRMREASIPCPNVVVLKKHVLVMSFIGKNTLKAPKLKDAGSQCDFASMYEQTVQIMKTLYSECKLIHADLSEYNLLWHEEKVWVIDVSQAVETTHYLALEFLLRDCTNISSFFQKSGVLGVSTPEDLFFKICGKYPIFKADELPPEKEEP